LYHIFHIIRGFIQEYRAERSLEAIKNMASPHALVIREGKKASIDATQLVPGDIIWVEAGDKIPADVRFLETYSLEIEEAALTGESVPVAKNSMPITAETPLAERFNLGFMGTSVTRGRGLAVVVETGMNTEMGKIAALIESTEQVMTPLQRKLDQLGKTLIVICLAVCGLVTVLGIFRGEAVKKYEQAEPELAVYAHYFDELFRQKEHILGEKEERLLAMSADLSSASNNIFTMLNNADIKFPYIRDENGQEVELTKGRYGRFMESQDRRVRKEAYEGLYSTYKSLSNTLAATYSSSIKRDIFYARARNYPSALHAALDQDNVPVDVYNQLLTSVHNHLDTMYRYMKIRKKMLQVDPLYMYDIYVPLVSEFNMKVPYEEAKEITLQALAPLGEEYLSVLQQGYNKRWIDAYENQGKTS
jgi:hypothetical protein